MAIKDEALIEVLTRIENLEWIMQNLLLVTCADSKLQDDRIAIINEAKSFLKDFTNTSLFEEINENRG
jgi:hypothetical protein